MDMVDTRTRGGVQCSILQTVSFTRKDLCRYYIIIYYQQYDHCGKNIGSIASNHLFSYHMTDGQIIQSRLHNIIS